MSFIHEHPGIIATLIISGGVLISAFLFTQDRPIQIAQQATASPTRDIAENAAQRDSDGDGLFDWEEGLWGTDPQKVDTDGDGVIDSEEVTQEAQARIKNNDTTPPVNEDLSVTSEFARSFFGDYLSLREDGTLTPEEARSVFTRGVSGLSINYPEKFVIPGENILPNEPPLTSAYLENLAIILRDSFPEDADEGEFALLERYVTKNNESAQAQLAQYRDGYGQIHEQLREIVVPETFAKEHRGIIHATTQMEVTTGYFVDVFEDPIAAILAVKDHPEASQDMLNALTSLYAKSQRADVNTQPATQELFKSL